MATRENRKKFSMVSRRRGTIGAPPGTLIPDPDVPPPGMHMIVFDRETIDEFSTPTFDEIKSSLGAGRIVWLDVEGVGNAEFISQIGKLFGIDELALEDVMNHHQRPKVEAYGDGVFIVAHMFSEGVESKEQYSLYLGEGFLVTFQEKPGDCLDAVRKRLQAGKGRIRTQGVDYLTYTILDALFDAYFPLTEKLGLRIEQLEDAIIADPTPAELAEVYRVRRELLVIKRSLWPSREMLSVLMHRDNEFVTPETARYLRDTHDHVMQLVDIVETYRELISGLIEFYASSIANRMNEVIKVLTVISTIFIPLGFLAGLWGMNFVYMPELHWIYGYPLAIAFMAFIAIGLLLWFRLKQWL